MSFNVKFPSTNGSDKVEVQVPLFSRLDILEREVHKTIGSQFPHDFTLAPITVELGLVECDDPWYLMYVISQRSTPFLLNFSVITSIHSKNFCCEDAYKDKKCQRPITRRSTR